MDALKPLNSLSTLDSKYLYFRYTTLPCSLIFLEKLLRAQALKARTQTLTFLCSCCVTEGKLRLPHTAHLKNENSHVSLSHWGEV